MGLLAREAVVGQAYILPALNILQISASMEGKEGFREAELYGIFLGAECNCMPAGLRSFFGSGSWFYMMFRVLSC